MKKGEQSQIGMPVQGGGNMGAPSGFTIEFVAIPMDV